MSHFEQFPCDMRDILPNKRLGKGYAMLAAAHKWLHTARRDRNKWTTYLCLSLHICIGQMVSFPGRMIGWIAQNPYLRSL